MAAKSKSTVHFDVPEEGPEKVLTKVESIQQRIHRAQVRRRRSISSPEAATHARTTNNLDYFKVNGKEVPVEEAVAATIATLTKQDVCSPGTHRSRLRLMTSFEMALQSRCIHLENCANPLVHDADLIRQWNALGEWEDTTTV